MKSGDKIEFTPEQRATLLPLFAESVLMDDAAAAAERRNALANRDLWRAIREALGLPTDILGLRVLPGFQGIEITHSKPPSDAATSVTDVIAEWQHLANQLQHSVSPGGVAEKEDES